MTRFVPATILLLAACIGGSGKSDPTGDTATGTADACALAADSLTCPECSNGPVTCTFDGHSETANSCGDCQARGALYQALCDEGVTDSRETIETDTVCEPAGCIVIYDGCYDPCTPLCVSVDRLTDTATSCDPGCSDTEPPFPGECVNTGNGCAFQ